MAVAEWVGGKVSGILNRRDGMRFKYRHEQLLLRTKGQYRVLVVVDDYTLRLLLEDELAEEGYEVVTIGDAINLREAIKLQRPDLVVVHLNMGQCNGSDILKDIRNSYNELPVILYAKHTKCPNDSRIIAADCFIVKGSKLNELKQRIKMALQVNLERVNNPNGPILDRVDLH